MCSSFLWSSSPNNHHKKKVAWEEVCLPKREGELDIRKLNEVTRVFPLSLIWKFFTLSDTLPIA